jgi:hypothetical protein
MSTRAGRSFLPDLRRLEAELAVPMPERLRFLRELEYDLEQLRDGLVARGMAADEARGRALEALLPDPRTLGELGRVHAPLYRRVTASVRAQRLRALERGALAVATASVVVVQATLLLEADLLDRPSPFLWPVLALGALLFALCAAKGFELWIERDHRTPARGLRPILGLCGAVLAAAFLGALIDSYRLAATLEASPGLAGTLGPRWLVRECALLAVAILVALAGGVTWFVLSQWVSGVSGARREVLGITPSPGEETPP